MHFLLTIAIITGMVGFAFGENIARGFLQGLFVLVGLATALLLWDFYREIPIKKLDRYKVLELEFEPKKRAAPVKEWTFK